MLGKALLLVLLAQDGSIPVYYLDEIVVTAKEPVSDISTVIELSPLKEKEQTTNLTDILMRSASFHFTVGRKGEPHFTLRGFPTKNVTVLLDGVPIYLPYDGQIDLFSLPISDIMKIKVTEGSFSAFYGPNSMGGVINIITRKPSSKPMLSLEAACGRGLWHSSLSLSKSFGALGILLSGEYSNSKGFYLPDNFTPDLNEDGGLRENSDLLKRSISSKVSYSREGDFALSLFFTYVSNIKGIPPEVGTDRPRFWRFTTWKKHTAKLSAFKTYKSSTFRFNIFYDGYYNVLDSYDDSTYSTQTKPYAFHSTYDDDCWGVLYSGRTVLECLIFKHGLYFKDDIHRQKGDWDAEWEKYEAYTISVPFEAEVTTTKRISIVVGGSFDVMQPVYAAGEELREPIYAVNPLAGLSLRKGNTKLHLAFSMKTRFPTLKELYSEYLGKCIPNPELAEERSTNAEIGADIKFGNISITATLFSSWLKDMIERKYLGTDTAGNKIYQMQNIGKARLAGFEFHSNVKSIFGAEMDVSYTYLFAREWDDSENKWTHISFRPAHRLTLSITRSLFFGLEGNLTVNYTGRQFYEGDDGEESLSPYTLVDISLKRTVGPVEFYVTIKNAFDTYYEYEKGFPAPGRYYEGGLRLRTAGK